MPNNINTKDFFSINSSPVNWGIKQAEKNPGCKATLITTSLPGLSISSTLKNLACLVTKIFVTAFALTIGQIPAVKARTWQKLQDVNLVGSSVSKTLLHLAMHLYKTVMFLAFSPFAILAPISLATYKSVFETLHLIPKQPVNIILPPPLEEVPAPAVAQGETVNGDEPVETLPERDESITLEPSLPEAKKPAAVIDLFESIRAKRVSASVTPTMQQELASQAEYAKSPRVNVSTKQVDGLLAGTSPAIRARLNHDTEASIEDSQDLWSEDEPKKTEKKQHRKSTLPESYRNRPLPTPPAPKVTASAPLVSQSAETRVSTVNIDEEALPVSPPSIQDRTVRKKKKKTRNALITGTVMEKQNKRRRALAGDTVFGEEAKSMAERLKAHDWD